MTMTTHSALTAPVSERGSEAPPLGALVQYGTRPARWIGLHPDDPTAQTGRLLVDGYVVNLSISNGYPRCETDDQPAPLDGAVDALVTALNTAVARLDEASHRLDDIVSDAHEWADDHDLCSVFDRFCEEHDLPGRIRTYEVSITITGTIEGRNEQDARAELCDRWITDRLDWADAEVTEE